MSTYFPAVRLTSDGQPTKNRQLEIYGIRKTCEPLEHCEYVDPFPTHRAITEKNFMTPETLLSKNMFYPLEPNKFFSFASVINLFKVQERRIEPTYITMTTRKGGLDTETVNGTSFGVALTLALADVRIPHNEITNEPLIVFTGTIQTIGMREDENMDDILLEKVSLTPIKAEQARRRGIVLFAPFNPKEPEILLHPNVIIGKTLGYALKVARFVEQECADTPDWEGLRRKIIKRCGTETPFVPLKM